MCYECSMKAYVWLKEIPYFRCSLTHDPYKQHTTSLKFRNFIAQSYLSMVEAGYVLYRSTKLRNFFNLCIRPLYCM